jgi:hypothetical protein
MRAHDLTRFGLRLLGLWLLVFCCLRLWPDLANAIAEIAQGKPDEALRRLRGPVRFFTTHTSNGMTRITGMNRGLWEWYFRFGLGVYLTFWNAGLARLLWRGIGDSSRCARCGYARTGLARDAACPECGAGDR